MVSLRAASSLGRPGSGSSMRVWTEPLPKVGRPTIRARPLFLRAPATISLAEAELPLTSTTSGRPTRSLGSLVASRTSRCRWAPSLTVLTITPSERKRSESSTASSSRPPGLPRRSRISPLRLPPALAFCCWMAWSTSRVPLREKPASRR